MVAVVVLLAGLSWLATAWLSQAGTAARHGLSKAPEQSGPRAFEVTGAGDARVNGVYVEESGGAQGTGALRRCGETPATLHWRQLGQRREMWELVTGGPGRVALCYTSQVGEPLPGNPWRAAMGAEPAPVVREIPYDKALAQRKAHATKPDDSRVRRR